MDTSVQSICISLLLTFVLCGVGLGFQDFRAYQTHGWRVNYVLCEEQVEMLLTAEYVSLLQCRAQAKSGRSIQLSHARVIGHSGHGNFDSGYPWGLEGTHGSC
jgi:hypothetical protein